MLEKRLFLGLNPAFHQMIWVMKENNSQGAYLILFLSEKPLLLPYSIYHTRTVDKVDGGVEVERLEVVHSVILVKDMVSVFYKVLNTRPEILV